MGNQKLRNTIYRIEGIYFKKTKQKQKKKKTTKLWLKNRTTRSEKTGPDRRTVETQSHTEEQWKHGAIQRNSGNTEPGRRTVETQNHTEEQWKHGTKQ